MPLILQDINQRGTGRKSNLKNTHKGYRLSLSASCWGGIKGMLISVIMPVYGVEKYIKDAIESVLNQTYKNFELIIVDDNTKDKSITIANHYASRDHRLKIYKTPENVGLAKARNFGMQYIKGKYILFMDSDDTIPPETLDKYVGCAEKFSPDFIIAGYTDLFLTQKEKLKSSATTLIPLKVYENNRIKEMFAYFDLITVARFACNKFYKTSFLQEHKLQFEKLEPVEDICFNLNVFNHAKSLATLNFSLYNYFHRKTKKTLSEIYDDTLFEKYKTRLNRIVDMHKNWKINSYKNYDLIYTVYFRLILSVFTKILKDKHLKKDEKNKLIRGIIKDSDTQYCISNIAKPSRSIKIFIGLLKKERIFLIKLFILTISFIKTNFAPLYSKLRHQRDAGPTSGK